MTVLQAIEIISQVCAQHKGTLRDHELIQQALIVITETIEATAAPPPERQQQGAQHGHA